MMGPDVEHVLAAAKEWMLTSGSTSPLIVVSVGAQPILVPVTEGWNDDNAARAKTLFLLGRTFAQERHIKPEAISALFLVMEVWVARPRKDEPEPESHPDRKEALSVLELRTEGKTLRQSAYLFDILRHGGVIDLGPQRKMREIQSPLLPSFFAGVGSAQMSDRQFLQYMQNIQDISGQ